MEQIKFSSVDELFNRLKPAFNTKLNELRLKGINFIEISDMWKFLSKTKWSNEHDLELCDMVNDIFNVDETNLINYIKQYK